LNNGFYYNTKIGVVGIVENGEAITNIYFGKIIPNNIKIIETELLKMAAMQIAEYFQNERISFELPLHTEGTKFQEQVWNELKKIPYGSTWTYKELAENINNSKACRAVGNANNKNPIPIIIPCHRVIGSTGKLVGYAGGLDIKKKLLGIEKINEI